MGLGGAPSEWRDYEWVRLADLPDVGTGRSGRADALATAMADWVGGQPFWAPDGGTRVLLVDLDNLRAASDRLRGRLAFVVALARQADVCSFAGQAGQVTRSKAWLGEYARDAVVARPGPDAADHLLLAAADAVEGPHVQFVVVSNDGIFAELSARGPIVLVSPGADALSDRLGGAARAIVDLAVLEADLAAGRVPVPLR